ncbi:MAG: hypothetical protein AB1650_03525 [Candidatus Omnitrophota bacterium]
MRKIFVGLCALLAFVSVCGTVSAEKVTPKQLKSTELKDTIITAYLQNEMVAGKNMMFCSTFQIAWDILSDEIIKEPLQLSDHPKMEQALNQRLTGVNDISEDYYLAMAGFNKDGIVEKIKQALKAKFNETPGIDITLERSEDILAYAFLFKDLKFDNEFENLDAPILFKGESPVKSFGIKKYAFDEDYRKVGEQVEILDYTSDDDFVLLLKSDSPRDEIILAKVKQGKTLLETVDSVFSRIGNKETVSLGEGDTLQIPKIDFDILREYSEIMGKGILNKGFADYVVSKAIQSIRFRLNEKGALLKSEAAIAGRFKSISVNAPKNLVFNQSFLLCLKEKSGKYPYFVMWVDNAELLICK